MFEKDFHFNKSIKKLTATDDKINTIVESYEPKIKVEIEVKKRVVNILNKIGYAVLDYYLESNAIVGLQNKYQRDEIDSVINKYSDDGSSFNEVINEIEMFRKRKIYRLKKVLLLKE